jgi:hypothetical protein
MLKRGKRAHCSWLPVVKTRQRWKTRDRPASKKRKWLRLLLTYYITVCLRRNISVCIVNTRPGFEWVRQGFIRFEVTCSVQIRTFCCAHPNFIHFQLWSTAWMALSWFNREQTSIWKFTTLNSYHYKFHGNSHSRLFVWKSSFHTLALKYPNKIFMWLFEIEPIHAPVPHKSCPLYHRF